MFTGIVEEVGEVQEIRDLDGNGGSNGFRSLSVRARRVLEDVGLGSSIAVNGVCLTVVRFDPASFAVELSHETLERTSLNGLASGSQVNLERPMRADGRFGGHFVQGHVDGVGKIASFERKGDNWNLRVEYPTWAARYIVEKGSITVDGISLTVAALRDGSLDVAIIPHTLENTNLKRARAGDAVNLELDVVAKYVERMLGQREVPGGGAQ